MAWITRIILQKGGASWTTCVTGVAYILTVAQVSHKKQEESFCLNLFFRSSYFTRSKLLLGSDGHEGGDHDDDDDDDDDYDDDDVSFL